VETYSLDESCTKYIGELLLVETQYGWGWSFPSDDDHFAENGQPIDNFLFRLAEVTAVETNPRHGGRGVIEDRTSKYNGYYLEFTTRHSGRFDFDSNPPICNLFISLERKVDAIYPRRGVAGWGVIGKSGR